MANETISKGARTCKSLSNTIWNIAYHDLAAALIQVIYGGRDREFNELVKSYPTLNQVRQRYLCGIRQGHVPKYIKNSHQQQSDLAILCLAYCW